MVAAQSANLPRVVIAAAASGHGKTSVATGLLAAYRARGLTVSPHKVGPDYIDPGYHALAAGRPGRNLDPWLVGEDLIAGLFVHGATTPEPADIAIVEGVMGLFDGATGQGQFASTAHVSQLLRAPVILVVDGTGVGRSIGALVHGFSTFSPDVWMAGVILNQVGTERHETIMRDAVEEAGLPVFGAIRRQEALAVPSRHLGLIPAAERSAEALETVRVLGEVMAESIDLDAVLALARTVPRLDAEDPIPPPAQTTRTRIAVAGGAAFTFGYAEQVELLRAAGAEVVTFDPIRDPVMPAGTAGVIIGGGFPEVHAGDLAANVSLRKEIRALAEAGIPIAAECAGLLYLANRIDGHEMCGVLDLEATMTSRLTLGYRDAVAPTDTLLAAAGTRAHGHEFHRTKVTGPATSSAWQWSGADGLVSDGAALGNVHASYLHLHWAAQPAMVERFVDAACRAGAEQ